eukprot:gene17240-12329_t
MLQHPHIGRHLHTLILGDYVYLQQDTVIIQDWDWTRPWCMPIELPRATLRDLPKTNENDADSLEEGERSPFPIASTPVQAASPSRRLSSGASPMSASALRLLSPKSPSQPTAVVSSSPFGAHDITSLTSRFETMADEDGGDSTHKREDNDHHDEDNDEDEDEDDGVVLTSDVSLPAVSEGPLETDPVIQLTQCLANLPRHRVRSLTIRATDTEGIPLRVAVDILHQLALTDIRTVALTIKDDELHIGTLLQLFVTLVTSIPSMEMPHAPLRSISINEGLVSLQNGALFVVHDFFCRSRPRVQLPLLSSEANEEEMATFPSQIALSAAQIRVIEEALLSLDVYVQDVVQVDPALLVMSTEATQAATASVSHKASLMWIDRFNTWCLRQRQATISQRKRDSRSLLHASTLMPSSQQQINDHDDTVHDDASAAVARKMTPTLTFYPASYVDNPLHKDPFDRIHRDLFWTSYVFALAKPELRLFATLFAHAEEAIEHVSLVNLQLTDTSLRELLTLTDLDGGGSEGTVSETRHPAAWLSHVRSLALTHNQLTDAALTSLAQTCFQEEHEAGASLTSLDVSHNGGITLLGVKTLLVALNQLKLTSLRRLVLSHTALKEDRSTQYLPPGTVLTEYYPFYKELPRRKGDDTKKPLEIELVQLLIDSLLTHAELEELLLAEHIRLDRTRLELSTNAHLLRQETQGMAMICASRPFLTHLILRQNHLQDDQVVDISAAIQFLPTLAVLDVSYNLLTNVGISLLAETLLIYGDELHVEYLDVSFNAGGFVIPNVHRALDHYFASHRPDGPGMVGTSSSSCSSLYQRRKGLSSLMVRQQDHPRGNLLGHRSAFAGGAWPMIYLHHHDEDAMHCYRPYLLIQTRPGTPLQREACQLPVGFEPEVSGGDVLVDLSGLVMDGAPAMRQQMDTFLAHAQRLFHDHQHNITTAAPMGTMSLILDHASLDASFFTTLPKYMDGLVTLSLQYANMDDTQAMHLEYALSPRLAPAVSVSVSVSVAVDGTPASSASSASSASVATATSTPLASATMSAMTHLRSLQLQGNLISDTGAQALLAYAAQPSSLALRHLSLARNALLKEVINGEALAKFVGKRPPPALHGPALLLSLDLSYTSLQDTTALLLARTLAHPHCLLEVLNVSFTQITATAAMRILQALNTNRGLKSGIRSLRSLDVSYNTLPNVMLMMVLLKLPQGFPLLETVYLMQEHLQQSTTMTTAPPSASSLNPTARSSESSLHTVSLARLLASSDPLAPSTLAAVDTTCTHEDLEMMALELLQEEALALQQVVLYPVTRTRALPPKISPLLRRLYETPVDMGVDRREPPAAAAAAAAAEVEPPLDLRQLYPTLEPCQQYFDASSRRLSIVIRQTDHTRVPLAVARTRIKNSVFQNPLYASALDVSFVFLSSAAVAPSSATATASTATHHRSSVRGGETAASSSHAASTTGSIFHDFIHAYVLGERALSQARWRSLTLIFTVLLEEDLMALCDAFRVIGGPASPATLRVFCGTFVPAAAAATTMSSSASALSLSHSLHRSQPPPSRSLAATAASKATAASSSGYSAYSATAASTSRALAPPSVASTTTPIKRYGTPTKFRSPPSSLASLSSPSSTATPAALPAASQSSRRLSSSTIAATSAALRVTNESRVPGGAATSPASRVHSIMDALCLVGGVHHVVLRELSHDLTDGFWQSWVHPHEGKRDEVEAGEAGSLRIHFTT